MSARSEQVEPFLGGVTFPAYADIPYPRSDPVASDFLPNDVWQAAQLPVGVRLELSGSARSVEIGYRTMTGNLGYRGEGAGCTFVAYRAGQKIAEEEAVLGEGVVRLDLPGDSKRHVTIYLPEGMKPVIDYIVGLDGSIELSPRQPKWIAYGDAVTQGWLASTPSLAWPSVVARKIGFDVCNLGYAGSARAETNTAVMIARMPADVITIAYGTNCWGRIPHSVGLMAESIKAFIGIIRSGHPATPIVVVSPILYPEAENIPNVLGATMSELRMSMDAAVRECMAAGDLNIRLVSGAQVLSEEDLVDGVYPGDEGHKRIATAVGKHLSQLQSEINRAAEERWHLEARGIEDHLEKAAESAVYMAREDLQNQQAQVPSGFAQRQSDSPGYRNDSGQEYPQYAPVQNAAGQHSQPAYLGIAPVLQGNGPVSWQGQMAQEQYGEQPQGYAPSAMPSPGQDDLPQGQWANPSAGAVGSESVEQDDAPDASYQVIAHYRPGSGYGSG
ncbi:MAG: SGNH/GDSL hydrolase family protein [Acidimicrobiales bacterium]